MGNLISAVLMSVLEIAWVLQRYLDQDYRQNHGSRLLPIEDLKSDMEPSPEVIFPKGTCTPILSRSPHHRSKPAHNVMRLRHNHQKTRSDPITGRKSSLTRGNHQRHMRASSMHVRKYPNNEDRELLPHENQQDTTTCDCLHLTDTSVNDTTSAWVRRHAGPCIDQPLFRRAFSEIDLRSANLRSESPLRLVIQGCAPHRKHDFKIYASHL